MPPVQIKPDVYWIGVNDRTTDLFEGLWPIEQEGVSYNAYLIDDEKKAIIDLSKALKTDEFFDQIDQVTDISQLDYIVINHIDAFTETQDIVARDDFLRFVAMSLNETVETHGTPNDFIGHTSGNDFMIVTVPSVSEKIKEDLGFRTEITLEEGIRGIIDDYRKAKGI